MGGLGAVLIVGRLVWGVFGPGLTNLLFVFAVFGVIVLLLSWLALRGGRKADRDAWWFRVFGRESEGSVGGSW